MPFLTSLFLVALLTLGSASGRAYGDEGLAASGFDFSTASLSAEKESDVQCPVEPGTYRIRTVLGRSYALDVKGSSKKAGANVQLKAAKKASQWILSVDASGRCTLTNAGSAKVLGVEGHKAKARANVQQQKDAGKASQRWTIVRSGSGYALLSAADKRYALDVAGGVAKSGANVRLAAASSAKSQRFVFQEIDVLDEGSYRVHSALSPKLAVDVPGCSTKAGMRMQVWEANDTIAQRLFLRRTGTSSYTVQAACSGLYLTDKGGKIVQRPHSGKASQTWKAYPVGSAYELVNAATGKRMALAGAGKASGTKLSTTKASSKATRFVFNEADLVPQGYYTVRNAGGMMLDIAGSSLSSGANVQVYKANGTAAQVFRFKPLGNGFYRIISDASGKVISVKGASNASGANVIQQSAKKSSAQIWRATMREDGGIQFVNKASGKVLEAASGGKKSGANVRQATLIDAEAAQGWALVATQSQSISGNYLLDSYLRSVAGKNGYSLRKCFNWVTSNIRWNDSLSGLVLKSGIISKSTTTDLALYAFKHNSGDCYYYASAFKWLAVACGYKANARAGSVPVYGGGTGPHGWTEVFVDGVPYVCDADLALNLPRYNWYMVSYGDAAVEYYL